MYIYSVTLYYGGILIPVTLLYVMPVNKPRLVYCVTSFHVYVMCGYYDTITYSIFHAEYTFRKMGVNWKYVLRMACGHEKYKEDSQVRLFFKPHKCFFLAYIHFENCLAIRGFAGLSRTILARVL